MTNHRPMELPLSGSGVGLTQAELAERCGIDQGDVSRIERGSVNPTARTLQRLADALDAKLQFVPLVS